MFFYLFAAVTWLRVKLAPSVWRLLTARHYVLCTPVRNGETEFLELFSLDMICLVALREARNHPSPMILEGSIQNHHIAMIWLGVMRHMSGFGTSEPNLGTLVQPRALQNANLALDFVHFFSQDSPHFFCDFSNFSFGSTYFFPLDFDGFHKGLAPTVEPYKPLVPRTCPCWFGATSWNLTTSLVAQDEADRAPSAPWMYHMEHIWVIWGMIF